MGKDVPVVQTSNLQCARGRRTPECHTLCSDVVVYSVRPLSVSAPKAVSYRQHQDLRLPCSSLWRHRWGARLQTLPQRHPHSTMSSDLSLWCYYWEHGNLSPFEIKVPPNATVDNCMRRILQRRKSDSPIGCTRLYKIPQNHPVPLHDIESTLGALSVSDLGSHLHIHELMQDIFQPHPEEGHLHLVLVDRGMYRLWLQCDGTNISY